MAAEEDPKVPMDDQNSHALGDEGTMLNEDALHSSPDLRKRRSTRIVQAVPLQVTGVDALGRPFQERTSTLVINCHGARYQSKHYVLKNMWVTLDVPHPDPNQTARTVRGRVAWIQRPRTVRQLFQVAIELELAGNAWGIAFPPEDWFAFPDAAAGEISIASLPPLGSVHEDVSVTGPEGEAIPSEHPSSAEIQTPSSKGVHVLPAPTNTDTSLQLARQVTRLLTEAKQQIQAASRESAAMAVAAELGAAMESVEAKISAARAGLAAETARSAEKLFQETDARAREAQAATVEMLQRELPGWASPRIEQLTHDLTEQLSHNAAAHRSALEEQTRQSSEALRAASESADQTVEKLRAAVAEAETNLVHRAESARVSLQEAVRQHDMDAAAHRESLAMKAEELRQQIAAAVAAVEAGWQERLAESLVSAQAQLRATLESEIASAEQAARTLDEQTRAAQTQLQEEAARQAAALLETAAASIREAESKIGALRDAADAGAAHLQDSLSKSDSAAAQIEQAASHIAAMQHEAGEIFKAHIANLQHQRTEELQHRSEYLFGELSARLHTAFEEASRDATARFEAQIRELAQPHITGAEEAVQRLAGGRSLFDAAISMQREKIRAATEESFAEALAEFRGQIDTVEKSLDDAAEAIVARHAGGLDARASQLQHATIEQLFKSAEWYEKKAQTQFQQLLEKSAEQSESQLREKAGQLSRVFASELDHYSRNFVEHAQRQMEEVVREAFDSSRSLFAEAADTTTAAFTDEIQRQARQELDGFTSEVRSMLDQSRAESDTIRQDLSKNLTVDQETFLRRFQSSMTSVVDSTVTAAQGQVQAGMQPLFDSLRNTAATQQAQVDSAYREIGDRFVEQYRARLENVSNSWMVATVTTLDHQSRGVLEAIARSAEEKLREMCAQVFAGAGEALRAKLQEIPSAFNSSKSATSGQ